MLSRARLQSADKQKGSRKRVACVGVDCVRKLGSLRVCARGGGGCMGWTGTSLYSSVAAGFAASESSVATPERQLPHIEPDPGGKIGCIPWAATSPSVFSCSLRQRRSASECLQTRLGLPLPEGQLQLQLAGCVRRSTCTVYVWLPDAVALTTAPSLLTSMSSSRFCVKTSVSPLRSTVSCAYSCHSWLVPRQHHPRG